MSALVIGVESQPDAFFEILIPCSANVRASSSRTRPSSDVASASRNSFRSTGFGWSRHSTLDRLLHHAVVIQIEGSSYRLCQHAALVPENVRSRPLTNLPQPKRRGRPPGRTKDDPDSG